MRQGGRARAWTLALALAWGSSAHAAPLLPVPLVSQSTGYSCGAAALLSVLLYFRVFDGPESELHGPLGVTPQEGTHPDRIVAVARRYGLQAEKRVGLGQADLVAALADGALVILDIQAWPVGGASRWEQRWEDGHYVVLVGADERNLYVMDPSLRDRYGFIPRGELAARWHDYEREGRRRRVYEHMAIVIRGRQHLNAYPGAPVPIP
jgi:predicted double-glycine peptidase